MCRENQAPAAANLIREIWECVGYDKALEVATARCRRTQWWPARSPAERYGGNTMKELARLVREVWAEGDAATIHFLEESDRVLSFDAISA